jgi:hypothetical protein
LFTINAAYGTFDCGHPTVDTTNGYAAIYPEDVISHHRAFIARRRAERPSEESTLIPLSVWDRNP